MTRPRGKTRSAGQTRRALPSRRDHGGYDMELRDFHALVGETIMYCQVIERDVKIIYAAMSGGDMGRELRGLERERLTFGETVRELRILDRSSGAAYFTDDDYDYLMRAAETRNHWCHEAYLRFAFDKAFTRSRAFAEESERLLRDHDRLGRLCRAFTDVRLRVLRDFGILP